MPAPKLECSRILGAPQGERMGVTFDMRNVEGASGIRCMRSGVVGPSAGPKPRSLDLTPPASRLREGPAPSDFAPG